MQVLGQSRGLRAQVLCRCTRQGLGCMDKSSQAGGGDNRDPGGQGEGISLENGGELGVAEFMSLAPSQLLPFEQ